MFNQYHICSIPDYKGVEVGNRWQCSCGNLFEYKREIKLNGYIKYGWKNLGEHCIHHVPKNHYCLTCNILNKEKTIYGN